MTGIDRNAAWMVNARRALQPLPPPTTSLVDVVIAVAASIVETQHDLDTATRESVERFGVSGNAPTGFAITQLRIEMAISAHTAANGVFAVAPRLFSTGRLALAVTSNPTPLPDLLEGLDDSGLPLGAGGSQRKED